MTLEDAEIQLEVS